MDMRTIIKRNHTMLHDMGWPIQDNPTPDLLTDEALDRALARLTAAGWGRPGFDPHHARKTIRRIIDRETQGEQAFREYVEHLDADDPDNNLATTLVRSSIRSEVLRYLQDQECLTPNWTPQPWALDITSGNAFVGDPGHWTEHRNDPSAPYAGCTLSPVRQGHWDADLTYGHRFDELAVFELVAWAPGDANGASCRDVVAAAVRDGSWQTWEHHQSLDVDAGLFAFADAETMGSSFAAVGGDWNGWLNVLVRPEHELDRGTMRGGWCEAGMLVVTLPDSTQTVNVLRDDVGEVVGLHVRFGWFEDDPDGAL